MSNLSLMIIDPSVTHPEVASFNKIVSNCPFPCSYHLPVMSDTSSLSNSFSNTCGIIILGSAASVNEKSDWQLKLGEILDSAMHYDIPVLGICFGHQFLAKHLGGKVDYLWDKKKRKGVRKVNMKISSLIESDYSTELIYSHQEGVVKSSDDINITASSEMVNVEGICHKTKPIWGFQTHIEASLSFAKRQDISKKQYEKIDNNGTDIMKAFYNKI